MLDAHDLAVCGRHVGLEAAEDDLGGLAAELETLGTDRLIVAWIEPPRTPAEADAAVARLVRAAERASDAGLRLGFHNHDAEVAAQSDGRSVLDLLLAADDGPFLELDLGWAWYAGVDPIALLDAARRPRAARARQGHAPRRRAGARSARGAATSTTRASRTRPIAPASSG